MSTCPKYDHPRAAAKRKHISVTIFEPSGLGGRSRISIAAGKKSLSDDRVFDAIQLRCLSRASKAPGPRKNWLADVRLLSSDLATSRDKSATVRPAPDWPLMRPPPQGPLAWPTGGRTGL
jgi:hypothetical protein